MALLPEIKDGRIVEEKTAEQSAEEFAYSTIPASKQIEVQRLIHNEGLSMRAALSRVGVSIGCIR